MRLNGLGLQWPSLTRRDSTKEEDHDSEVKVEKKEEPDSGDEDESEEDKAEEADVRDVRYQLENLGSTRGSQLSWKSHALFNSIVFIS